MKPKTGVHFRSSVWVLLLTAATLCLGVFLVRNHLVERPYPHAWYDALPVGDPPKWLSIGEVVPRKLRLDQETRNALGATTLEGKLTVPQEARIEVAFASLCPEGTTCLGGWRFSATVRGTGDTDEELFEVTLTDSELSWRVERVDLSAFAGQVVHFTLSSRPTGGHFWPHSSSRPMAVWAEPLLIVDGRTPASPTPERPNVLLISIDTLRADRLGSYGYGRPTSPVLDAFAADGVRFAEAISQSPWTIPSHMSLFTSRYPSSHGVNLGTKNLKSALNGVGTYPVLPESVPTLAEVLRADGYRTLGLTGGGTMSGEFGFARGFDIYLGGVRRADDGAFEKLRDWLDTHGRSTDPFFLFFHTFEVHAAYTRGEFAAPLLSTRQRAEMERMFSNSGQYNVISEQKEWLEREDLMRREVTSALYDGGIRHTDRFLGRLFESLRLAGLYENTIIVVTSDHGEEFGDHDPGRIYDAHCTTLFEELIHVPLILRAPDRLPAGRVVTGPVELVDVMPTLLDLVDVEKPVHTEGRSLLSTAEGQPQLPGRTAFSEATCTGPEWKAVRTANHKYFMLAPVSDRGERSGIPAPPSEEALYDLRTDPSEQSNIYEVEKILSMTLRQQVVDHFRAVAANSRGAASETVVGPDTLEQLRALGYLE